jgi:hypothetical protein
MTSGIFRYLAACALLLCGVGPIQAQNWPSKPVRLVVAFPLGGIVDNVARQIQPRLQAALGQTVIIDNRGGAGGTVGSMEVARAAPDGHTLLMVFDSCQPGRVVFGPGALSQAGPGDRDAGRARALVLSTPEQRASAERIADMLGARAAGVFDRAVMHVPIETAREAREVARKLDADCAVAVGGGSTTGLGKAIALESGLPILAIPTTYAGSEMTPIFGITEAGLKKTGKDAKVLPRTVIYDPELTLTLPVGLSVTSGINAIAHAAEGLYSVDGNPGDGPDGGGRHPRRWAWRCRPSGATRRHRGARPGPVRRLAVRHRAGQRRHGAAPQAVPHAGRQLQPAACRDPHHRAAACAGLQRRGRAAAMRASRVRWVAPARRRPCTTWPRPTARRWR